MKNTTLIIVCGFSVWLIPFCVAFVLFPLKETALFDSLLAVALAFSACLATLAYFRRVERAAPRHAAAVGAMWMLLCIVIDVPMFVALFGWTLEAYIADVGVTYLMIPVVTTALGSARTRANAARQDSSSLPSSV